MRAALVLTVLLGSCAVSVPNGALHCAETAPFCPQGYVCAYDGTCWHTDDAPASPQYPVREACANNGACRSGFCADGLCCETACDGACQSCALPGSEGRCKPVDKGLPSPGGHATCSVVCTNDVESSARCDGDGGCEPTLQQASCAPFRCEADGVSCAATCIRDSDCLGGNRCIGGSCGKKSNGALCSADGDCLSRECAQGICCDRSCGTCETCTTGQCSPLPAASPPRDLRGCDGVGVGAGPCGTSSCDGAGACMVPDPLPVCGVCQNVGLPSIDGQWVTTIQRGATCLPDRSCQSTPVGRCDMGFACKPNEAHCPTVCARHTDCVMGFYCSKKSSGSGVCKPRLPFDALCNGPFDCASGRCLAVTAATSKRCVDCVLDPDCLWQGDRPSCDVGRCRQRDCSSGGIINDCSLRSLGTSCGTMSAGVCSGFDEEKCSVYPAATTPTGTVCGCGSSIACAPGFTCTSKFPGAGCKIAPGFPCLADEACTSGSCDGVWLTPASQPGVCK